MTEPGSHFTPETGFPNASCPPDGSKEYYDPNAIFTFSDGTTSTGSQINDFLEAWADESERGAQFTAYLRGETGEPTPLYVAGEDEQDGIKVFLGNGEAEVTDIESESALRSIKSLFSE